MLKKYHTLPYIYNRIKLKLYEIEHPEHPWMTSESIRLLGQLIRPCDIGLE
jgi:hypothetical protein